MEVVIKHFWETKILLVLAANIFNKNPEISTFAGSYLQKFAKSIQQNTISYKFSSDELQSFIQLLAKGIEGKIPKIKRNCKLVFGFLRKNW